MKTVDSAERILGYSISTLSIEQSVLRIRYWLENEMSQQCFCCANPHSLVLAEDDSEFSTSLHDAQLLTPDGAGIVLASKILGGNIQERVTGSDIFLGLSKELNAIGGKSYYFLGSSEKTLKKISENMSRDYPEIRIAGIYSPPFKKDFSEEDNRNMVEAVNAASPDVLWVGLTAPKQEKWIYRNRQRLNVRFIGAIGAVFDFYAGNIKRSPEIFQRYGFEWFPRLLQEPRRLFKRNFISSPLFLLLVLQQLIRQKLGR